VRVDLGRMREGLGPLVADQLAARALEQRGDPMLRGLLACADVLWVGLRIAEIQGGDHVAIVEGKDCEVRADESLWKKVRSANGDLTVFDRIAPSERSETARVILAGERDVVLVSPTELASLDRVLKNGPDANRREPKAEGLLSLDLRTPRLPLDLEKKYPSIGAIMASIDRVRASTQLADGGLELEGEILLKTDKDAARALKFLRALVDNVESDAARLILASAKLEQIDHTLRIRWTVPAKVVLGLLENTAGKAEKSDKDKP
jgi:hypothetical protein